MLTDGRRHAAVLGSPIGHSLSPVLHRAAYVALGLAWDYRAVEVDSAGLAGFLAGLDDSWAGLSLTMPLKETVLPLLDEASPLVRLTRAANTLLLRGGRRVGENTDVDGIVAAVSQVHGPPFSQVCIIGAGATARSAMAASARLGASQVLIVARRPEAAQDVLEVGASLGLTCSAAAWDRAARGMDSELVIATVPGDAAASLAAMVPKGVGLLLDVTYWPWPTRLADAWQTGGGTVLGGESMLLWQAAGQVELMTGRPAPVEAMRRALQAAIAARTAG